MPGWPTSMTRMGSRNLFTEDAIWDGRQFGRNEGKEEIRSYLRQILKERITWAIHLMTNGEMEIDPSGAEATARWILWQPSTVNGKALWMTGKYLDHYRKVDGKWLISRLELDFEFTTPYESGWVKRAILTRSTTLEWT